MSTNANHLSKDQWLDMLRDIRWIASLLPEECFTEFHLGVKSDGVLLMQLEIVDGATGQKVFIPSSGEPTDDLKDFSRVVLLYLDNLKGR
jgi:hypothetical protein